MDLSNNDDNVEKQRIQGDEKKARQFDVMAMFETVRRTAAERNALNFVVERTNSSDEEDSIQSHVLDTEKVKQLSLARDMSKVNNSDEEVIGPPLPPGFHPDIDDDGDEQDDDHVEEDESPLERIPYKEEVVLSHGSRTVTALALDPSGARVVSGGIDYEMKFWDFAGMDASFKSFRTMKPCESHPIRSLEYSSTGDAILVVSGNSQAKLIDRDGFELFECIKGDQYIVDMAKTKGHTAMLNSGCWHPKVKGEFMTCSNDGTLRLWDIKQEGKCHKSCIKPRSGQGRKTVPTACTYNRDGLFIAAACQDGSIQLWDHRKNFVNVAMLCRDAHSNGSDTSSLCFSYDNKHLASRGGDDTLKLWDIRSFKKPLCTAQDLCNQYPMTDCLFSPDDRLVVTGLSVQKGEKGGKIVFMDRQTLSLQAQMEISDSSVVRCLWHPKLNQIVATCGDGQVKVYYDPDKSYRGAMLCLAKKQGKRQQIQFVSSTRIITPHALPIFREERAISTAKREEKARKDPVKSHRPDLPVTGPGEGGRVSVRGATLSQYVVQQLVLRKPDDRDKDPRAAILRHAKDAEENPYWIDPAYKRTQPKKILASSVDEEDVDESEEPAWKKAKF